MRIDKGALSDFEIFLDKIAPLKKANKFGAISFRLPPSFTVSEFQNVERFLERIPRCTPSASSNLSSGSSSSEIAISDSYDYAVEFRHASWKTEGLWGLLRHYNIATALTDSQARENPGFLS